MIEELFANKKSTFDNFKAFYGLVVENGIFNYKIYDEMRSVAKFKYLHIGLSIV